MQATTERPSGYMLPVGQADTQRLDALGAIHNQKSLDLIKPYCLPGVKILDVGCGNGGLTCLFAKTFPDCKFVGVDISPEQIEICKKRSDEEKLTNIEWHVCDVYHLSDLKDKYPGLYDIVHSRFVLTHIPDLSKALLQMLSKLKPGELLILEEVGAKKKFKDTSIKALQAWQKMVLMQHKNQQSHPDTVEKAYEFLKDSNKVSSCVLKQFDLKIEGALKKSMFRMGAELGIKKITEMGKPELIKALGYEDSETWLKELRDLENDDSQTFEIVDNEDLIARKWNNDN